MSIQAARVSLTPPLTEADFNLRVQRQSAEDIEVLAPYKVDNAIIMAAGLSSRFLPLSLKRPKGLFVVKGEVLVERTIRQLREVGITDITVVVGYKKELFDYLENAFNVKLMENPAFETRNNNSTLKVVEQELKNTYLCSADNYLVQNIFSPFVYQPYYSCIRANGPTEEWCITTESTGRITDVTIGGTDAEVMYGPAYFDRRFSEQFVRILNDEYDLPQTASKYWEDLYREHLDQLVLFAKRYPEGIIHEFDSIADASAFDSEFIENNQA
jgi:CTP:phosphocholine cytidylyltransferase-like protein